MELSLKKGPEFKQQLEEEIRKVSTKFNTEIKKRDSLVEDLWMEVKKYRKKEKELIIKLEISEQVQEQLKEQLSNFVLNSASATRSRNVARSRSRSWS